MSDTPQPKRLEISPEDMEKVIRARERNESKVKVNEEWLFISEFGTYYGWEGVLAIMNNEISLEVAEMLLLGARKVWDGKVYDHATASFIGSVASQQKKPSTLFKKMTKDLIKRTKADV